MKKERDLYDICLGNVLRELRLLNQYSLQDVADKIGVTRQAIYYYENGRTPLTVVQLMKISNIYNKHYVEVMKDAQDKMSTLKIQ